MANKILLKFNDVDLTDYLASYADEENVLVKDEGRNARGNLRLTILNRKHKLYATTKYLTEAEMNIVRGAVSSFVGTTEFWDSKTGNQKIATMYVSTPKSEFYTNRQENGLYKPISINFIEL